MSGGPILVTGATGFVGRALIQECRRRRVPVIGVSRSPPRKRAAAIRWIRFADLNARRLRRLDFQSGALVHLAGASRDLPGSSLHDAIVRTTEVAVAAVKAAGGRRIVYPSGFGGSPSCPEAYFRAKAEAERIIGGSGIPHTIFRCSYILGPGDELTPFLTDAMRKGTVEIPGDGSYRIQPLFVEDVARIFLRAATEGAAPTGTFNLLGEPIAYIDLVRRFRDRLAPGARIRKVPVETFLRRALSSADPALTLGELAILLLDQVGPPTGAFLGVTLRGVPAILDRATRRTTGRR